MMLCCAAAAACGNLANGVTQPDTLQQQDLATVAPLPNNQRHGSTVEQTRPERPRVYHADAAAEQA